ncbi:hypothetical protein [Parasitella parasitica]|uniref:Uncharacterized protein n=1 Tax=Parasitella parasitica TaxID=35722 RepID=A0A0B7MX55_9FUNG|nr:hypothetical protein [Parasitella parasitica]
MGGYPSMQAWQCLQSSLLSRNSAASDDVAKRATSTSRSLCPMQIFGGRNKLGKIAITKSVGDHTHPLARDIRTYMQHSERWIPRT